MSIAIVDSSLLLEIDGGDSLAGEIFEHIKAKFTLGMTPTGVSEMVDIALCDSENAHSAVDTLKSFRQLGVRLLKLPDANHCGYAHNCTEKMIETGVLPDAEKNFGLIVCESAIVKAAVLFVPEHVYARLNIAEITEAVVKCDLGDCPRIEPYEKAIETFR